MDDFEVQIGRNVARMRGDMTQKELAVRMRSRGYKWSQATVWAIERGDRPLRVAELRDMAAILGRPTEDFFVGDELADVIEAEHGVKNARAELVQAMKDYDFYRALLRSRVAELAPAQRRDWRSRDGFENLLDETVETVARRRTDLLEELDEWRDE